MSDKFRQVFQTYSSKGYIIKCIISWTHCASKVFIQPGLCIIDRNGINFPIIGLSITQSTSSNMIASESRRRRRICFFLLLFFHKLYPQSSCEILKAWSILIHLTTFQNLHMLFKPFVQLCVNPYFNTTRLVFIQISIVPNITYLLKWVWL